MNIVHELINFLSILASLYILSLAYGNILNKSIKFSLKKIFIIILSSLIILISNYCDNFLLKTIIIVFSFYLPYHIFKANKEKSELFYVLLAIIFANIFDFILSLIITLLPNTPLIAYFSDAVFTIFVPLIILYIFSNKTFKSAIIITQKIISKKRISLMYIILTFILLTIISYINLAINDLFIRASLFCVALSILFLICKLITYKSKYDLNTIYTHYLVKCVKNCKQNNNELRKYKHNIKNKLLAINSLPNNSIKDYINNEILDIKTITKEYISNNETTCLTSYITEKLKQRNFSFKRIVILNKIKDDDAILNNPKLFITISEVLGVTLDNAIEASNSNSKSKIIIEIIESKTTITIIVTNDFQSNLIIDKIGKPLYTTKSNGTGIGLYSLNTNKRIKTHYQIINNKFICKVTINKSSYNRKRASI